VPAPAPADAVFMIEPFALAVNLQPGAVDQQMQWLRALIGFGKIVRPPPRRLSVVRSGMAMSILSTSAIDRSNFWRAHSTS
jgi:hypothetical protein